MKQQDFMFRLIILVFFSGGLGFNNFSDLTNRIIGVVDLVFCIRWVWDRIRYCGCKSVVLVYMRGVV